MAWKRREEKTKHNKKIKNTYYMYKLKMGGDTQGSWCGAGEGGGGWVSRSQLYLLV